MKTYLFTYCLSFLLATALTPVVIPFARRRKLMDMPDPRKIHSGAIPRVGGIAIFFAVTLTVLPVLALENRVGIEFRRMIFEVAVLLVSGTALFLVGLYDDLKTARVRTKLLAQCMGALFVCLAGIRIDAIVVRDLFTLELGWLSWVVTIVWIVGVTNAVNLIDGLDGLAAGISGIASGVIGVLAIWEGNAVLAVVMLALSGALTGFLFFNFHPARIFMGDGGSMYLGFVIAVSSVMTAAKSEALVGFCLPILVLGIPIFDTLFTILRRYLNRTGIMSPDRGHFHHLLLNRGLKQHHIAMLAYAVTALVSGLGLIMIQTKSTASVLLFLICLTLILMVFKQLGCGDVGNTLRAIQERANIAHAQRMEQKAFEDAQLKFRNTETFGEWWQCLKETGRAFDCASMSLCVRPRNKSPRLYNWECPNVKSEPMGKTDLVHIRIPMKDDRKRSQSHVDIAIICRQGSIESAGRRAALLTRLIEQHDPTRLPDTSETLIERLAEYPSHTGHGQMAHPRQEILA